MPAGALVTVPEPVPLLVTDRIRVVPPVADPLTAREMLSPLAAKFTLPAKVPARSERIARSRFDWRRATGRKSHR